MRLVRLVCGAALATFIGTSAAAEVSPWAASDTPAGKTRFIPVELWTGADWNGQHEIRMAPANLSFGAHGEKRISGPVAWQRPDNGETIQVYERSNKGKKQLFTLSSHSDGLGRVYDSRYPRDCVDEVKFPLGLWKENETRTFEVACNTETLTRTIRLTIENIDFTYNGMPHSLQFRWVVDGGTRQGTDMRYIYSPSRGLVYEDGD